MKTLRYIGLFVGLMIPAIAWATEGIPIADRYPLISLGLAVVLSGLVFAKVLTSWWELTRPQKVRRYLGTIIAGLGIFLVAFASTESRPAAGELPWLSSLADAQTLALDSGKPIMVDFSAEWCAACHELESEVFLHPEVRPRLESEFILLKVDMDVDSNQNTQLVQQFRVSGLPTVGFLKPDKSSAEEGRFEGKLGVDAFLERIDAVLFGGVAQEGEFEKTLREHGLFAALALVFLAGVASSFTPCVYPLIPITIGLFGAKTASTRRESFLLSSVYVAGIVLTYSALGLAAAALGTVFGGAMQSVWVVGGVSVLFVVLALSSLGLFEIRLPGQLQTRLGKLGGGGYTGALAMGLVAGIIAAPCVGPIVAGILVWVAQQQDLFLGWLFLSVFALGMGQLFLFLGTFSSMLSRLPRSGPWLESVKTVFAAVFFGMAIYYVRLVIPSISLFTNELWRTVGF